MLAVDMATLPNLQRPLILLHAAINVLDVAAVLALGSLALGSDHVLLLVLEVALDLVVHAADLAQFVVLRHSLLTHHLFRLLLSLLQFALHPYLSAHAGLHDLLGHAGVDSHQTLFFTLEFLLCYRRLLEVVLLFVLGEPFRQLVVVLETVPPIG